MNAGPVTVAGSVNAVRDEHDATERPFFGPGLITVTTGDSGQLTCLNC